MSGTWKLRPNRLLFLAALLLLVFLLLVILAATILGPQAVEFLRDAIGSVAVRASQ